VEGVMELEVEMVQREYVGGTKLIANVMDLILYKNLFYSKNAHFYFFIKHMNVFITKHLSMKNIFVPNDVDLYKV
jgi:hypothetical protein